MTQIPEKRGIPGAGVQRRATGGAPGLGGGEKISSQPKRRRRNKDGQLKPSSSRKRRFPKVLANWLILILCLIGLGFGSIFLELFIDHKKSETLAPADRKAAPLESRLALAMVEDLLSAKGPDDLDRLILPGELDTQEAFRFLTKLRENERSKPTPLWIGPLDSLSVPIEFISLRISGAPSRTVPFTTDSDGDWRIDFDAFARLCIPDFATILDKSEQGGIVRVHVTLDHYFNGWFKDDTEWDCYLLKYLESETDIFGYCRRGSPAHAAMEAIQQRSLSHSRHYTSESSKAQRRSATRAVRATLRIRRPIDAEKRQFEITNVISDDWIITESPFDERFANPE